MDTKQIQLTPEVIDAINGELAYQNTIAGTSRADTVDYGLAGKLLVLSRLTRKAEDAFESQAGKEAALNEVRKIAAVACRTLALCGCPKRQPKS